MLFLSSVAMTTEAAMRSPAVYGYCIGCTEWKEHIKENDYFFLTVAKTAPSTSEFRTNFIPWPTTDTLRLVSDATPAVFSIFNESTHSEVDFTAPSMPLVRTKRLASLNPTSHEYQLLDSNLSSQQFEEDSFLLICFLVVAVAAYVYVISCVEKEDNLSSTTGKEDFEMLELVPTIDDDDEHGDNMSEVRTIKTKSKSILVGSFSSEGKCVVNKQKAERRVHFEDEKDKGYSTVHTRYGDCKSLMQHTCNNSFQDMVSNEVLKLLLLDDPVDKCDTAAVMPQCPIAAVEKKEGQPQDVPPTKSDDDDDEESSSVDSNMIREYEDFLFQVSHSFLH